MNKELQQAYKLVISDLKKRAKSKFNTFELSGLFYSVSALAADLENYYKIIKKQI